VDQQIETFSFGQSHDEDKTDADRKRPGDRAGHFTCRATAHFNGYKISREGISAIEDYVTKERAADVKKWKSPALFLSPDTNAHGDGRLNPRVINTVFNEACSLAGVEGHTPHDARHAMGRHLIEKTGNIAAVQRQLGHTNAAYSIQYARVTDQELAEALDDR
jgi:site-specific recombinase XerD